MKELGLFIPGYDLKECLGEGGVSTVYKAVESGTSRTLAVKVLKASSRNDSRAVQRLEEEFRILRTLNHPNLATVHDYGFVSSGAPFIVMDYVGGDTIDVYHRKNPRDIWTLLYQVVEVLAFIHEHGLLHLDVKPLNIVVQRSDAYGTEIPVPVLLDFGLSRRATNGDAPLSIGTPAYAAPEKIGGVNDSNPAMDYYSLGATIYELIEGRAPFRGSTEEVLRGHLEKEVRFEKERIQFVELYPRVTAMMSKKPQDRFEAYEQLRDFLYAHTGRRLKMLNMAYGFGYVDSLGLIGKEDVWHELSSWVLGIAESVGPESRTSSRRAATTGAKTAATKFLVSGLDSLAPEADSGRGETDASLESIQSQDLVETPDVESLVKKLIVRASGRDLAAEPKPVPKKRDEYGRVRVISGGAGSGKSYLVRAVIGECRLKGLDVVRFGDGGDYAALTAADTESIAEGPMTSPIAERFARGWRRLVSRAAACGVVLVIDGYERLGEEEKQFLEYVAERTDAGRGEGGPDRIYLFFTGNQVELGRRLKNALPAGARAREMYVTPPGNAAVASLLEEFRGKVSERHEFDRLNTLLNNNRNSAGTLVGALKNAILNRHLELRGKRWRVGLDIDTGVRDDREDSAYYQSLLDGLSPCSRTVVAWLSGHPAAIDKSQFLAIAPIERREFELALRQVAPYGIVEETPRAGGATLAISGAATRREIYRRLDPEEKKAIHAGFVRHLEGELRARLRSGHARKVTRRVTQTKSGSYRTRLSRRSANELRESGRLNRLLADHYSATGDFKSALGCRIDELRHRIALNDLFGIRRACASGIQEVERYCGADDSPLGRRRWHLERLFVKEWIRAEKVSGHNGQLVEVFEKHVTARDRGLPLPFSCDYAHALLKVGRNEYKDVVRRLVRRAANASADAKASLALVQSWIVLNKGRDSMALDYLKKGLKKKELLSPDIRFSLEAYTASMKVQLKEAGGERYFAQVQQQLESAGQIELLLLLQLRKANQKLHQAKYSECRRILKKMIRIAEEHKVYYRLANAYIELSGVYYEEGDYAQALTFLDLGHKLAINVGRVMWTGGNLIRYAMIYRRLGHYGLAIKAAEGALRNPSMRANPSNQLRVYLILFELYNEISSRRAGGCSRRCTSLVAGTDDSILLAWYDSEMGAYSRRLGDEGAAERHFKSAVRRFERAGLPDDAALNDIRLAYLYIETGRFDRAKERVSKVREALKAMESKPIEAACALLEMSYEYARRSGKAKLRKHIRRCEGIRPKITDVKLAVEMDTMLFRAKARLGSLEESKKHFSSYFRSVKKIAGNLAGVDHAETLSVGPAVELMVREFRMVAGRRSS